MSEWISCIDADIFKKEDGTYDCPWLTPYYGDMTQEEYEAAGTALGVRRGCEYCYMMLEWKTMMKDEGWKNGEVVAHALHPDWPGEWSCVTKIFDSDGSFKGYEVNWKLYKTLHEAEAAGWELIYSYFPKGKEIYRKEAEEMPKQTYWTKCGRTFEKNSTAVVTGYTIDFENPNNEECTSCPFKIEVTEGWGKNKKFLRWECRAGSQPPNNTTEWKGSMEDKNTIQIHSLDNCFMEAVIEYCKGHPDLGASYNADHMADCRRTLSISCSQNKKGIAAKKELIEKFFPKINAVPDESFDDEPLFDEQKCRICGCTDSNGCPEGCYWVEGDLCSRCAEIESETWKQQTPEQKNAIPESCLDCSYRPINGQDSCNTTYVDQIASRKCGWYYNAKTGEMGELLYKVQYENEKVGEVKKVREGRSIEIVEKEEVIANAITFDYSTVDQATAEFLKEKANRITEIRIKSVVALGKELKEAQNKLANHDGGTFYQWFESIGLKKDSVYRYINAYEWVIANCDNLEIADNIQPSLLFEVSKPSAPKVLQTGVLAGDITTHKQYKELEARLREAEEAKEKNDDHYRKMLSITDENRIKAELALKKAKNESEANIRALNKTVQDLQQQLEQAKRNRDPSKVQELGQRIAEYQQEIKDYQNQIGNLNMQLAEMKKQLKDKPIEVPAVKVVEKVIERVPEQSKIEIINKTYAALMTAKFITKSDIEICKEAEFVRKNSIIEFLENLRDAIPEYLNILNENAEQPNCEDCMYADWTDLKEEDEAAGLVFCSLKQGQLVKAADGCSNFKEL